MSQPPNTARPDFAVIGAMRAGTTHLHEMLRAVKGVSVPKMKETDFYCSSASAAKGFAWYARQFDESSALWGDISPNYAKSDISPQAAELLHAANPDMRIFFIARDPVERAISHYKMAYFIEEDLPPPEALLSPPAGQHILLASSYYNCLLPFWERFDEQVIVLDFDMLVKNPRQLLARICGALGIPPAEVAFARAPSNYFHAVSRMPAWWSRLRRSELGTTLRAHVPRPLRNFVKTQAALAKPRPSPPPFCDLVRAQIAERITPDILKFRRKTGMAFEN
ncbi:MAG: sulfotransferase family protein [Hyphomonas sp.]